MPDTHPGTLPLRLYRGDSYAWQIRVWSDDAHTIPTDLTGVSARAEIKGGVGAIVLTCLITLPNTIALTLPASGWPSLGGTSKWDLQLTWADGRVYTLLAGPVSVTGDVVK